MAGRPRTLLSAAQAGPGLGNCHRSPNAMAPRSAGTSPLPALTAGESGRRRKSTGSRLTKPGSGACGTFGRWVTCPHLWCQCLS